MIISDLKISKMLEAHPETLDVLLQASPHFKKLKNKFLRKTLAGRVTVEQASGIAGVDLNILLVNLNKAIGEEEIFIKSQTQNLNEMTMNSENLNNQQKPEILKNISEDKIIELDVREDIASGIDPLKKILSTVKNLVDDNILHLINSFEPVPLYTVLKNKGYAHWTKENNGTWEIYFYKDENLSGEKSKLTTDEKSSFNLTGEEKIVELNVRELPPPEPMIKILETLSKIDNETLILVHHHREPVMLYEKLEERGYEALVNKIEDNYFKVLISPKKAEG